MLNPIFDTASSPPNELQHAAPDGELGRTRLNFGRILTFIRRRFKLAAGTAFLSAIAVLAYVFQLTPQYTAASQVLLDVRQVQVLGTDTQGSTGASLAGDASVESEVELVKSEAVALRVADKFLASKMSDSWKSGGLGVAQTSDGDQRILFAKALLSGLEVRRVRETYLISISYSAPNPELTPFIANAFADAYLEEQLNAKLISIQRANDLLDSRVSDLKSRVQLAEKAVEDSRLEAQTIRDLRDKSDAELRNRDLEREAAAARVLLESFLARSNEIMQQRNLQLPESRIVMRASLPSAPTGPNRPALALAGLLLSVGLGCGLAWLIDAMDQVVRSGEQVSAAVGARLLASVPKLHTNSVWSLFRRSDWARSDHIERSARLVIQSPSSAFSESIRTLRLATQGVGARRLVKTVMVTSILPGEGKSTVACSLAHYAASTGEKVLLIDMDLRRPSLTNIYAPEAGAGIIELLSGRAAVGEVVRYTNESKLRFIPASSVSSLGSVPQDKIMQEFLLRMREAFDLIVIDAPPLLPVADGRSLANLVDGVLLVVQWGKTSIDALVSATKLPLDFHGRVLGAVLTQVDLRKARLYDRFNSGYDVRAYQAEARIIRRTPRTRRPSQVPSCDFVDTEEAARLSNVIEGPATRSNTEFS